MLLKIINLHSLWGRVLASQAMFNLSNDTFEHVNFSVIFRIDAH